MSDHDPHPTPYDDDSTRLVLKVQQPLGASEGQTDIDIRISDHDSSEMKEALLQVGLPASDVIELSAPDLLTTIATSVSAAGGVTAFTKVILEFLRKDREKEYLFYVNGEQLKLKGISVRQAQKLVDFHIAKSLGLPLPSAPESPAVEEES